MISTSRRHRHRLVDTDDFLAMIARMVSAAGKRVADGDVEELVELIALRERLDHAILGAVRGLRESGVTWEDIGAATGTTRQAAIMKWAKRV